MLNRLLRLERSLVILDLETTGLNAERDRIIQMALSIHYTNPEREPVRWATLINPGIPITNTGSHKITDFDVQACKKCGCMAENHPPSICEQFTPWPHFEDLAPVLAQKFANVDIGGHNVNFDIGFMRESFIRSGIDWKWNGHVVDTLMICRLMMAHTLENAYRRLVDPAGFKDAHDAANDVAACEQVLAAQLKEFQTLPRTIPELSEFCFSKKDAIDKEGKFTWVNGVPTVTGFA